MVRYKCRSITRRSLVRKQPKLDRGRAGGVLARSRRSKSAYRAIPIRTASSTISPGALRHRARIAQPMVRRGWLERGPGPDDRRGRDEFVSVSWEKALDLLGDELAASATRVAPARCSAAPMAGRARAASITRRARCIASSTSRMGGYVRSVNSYSSGASSVLLPQILARLRGHHQAQRHLGADRDRDRDRAGVRRHGAEELHGGRRLDQQACRARRHGSGAQARLRVHPGQPAARRSAGRGRRRMDDAASPAPTPR